MALLAMVALLAVLFGYISVDSWYYILLAQSLLHGHGCSLHGEYSAVYPCGYPAVLALTAPFAGPATMMITGKVTNALLLAGSFWMMWRASRHFLLAALIVLNPVTVTIALYTWSETLLLFCFCGVVHALSRIHACPRRTTPLIWLTVFLVAGCFARYVFGPFAFLLFFCAWLAYGRRTAIRAFPAFVVAGLVFVAYQALNRHFTGFATGMPRVDAPEAQLFLVRQFLTALLSNGFGVVVAALLLTGISFRQQAFGRPDFRNRQSATSVFILAAGTGFLALALALRLHTQFDPYNTRTIGYGIVLAVAGMTGLFVHPREDTSVGMDEKTSMWPIGALVACAVFSFAWCDDGALLQSMLDAFDGSYALPASSLATLKGPPAPHTVVFFQLPVTGLETGDVDNIAEIYYGPDVTLISPLQGPDNPPETPAAFVQRIEAAGADNCAFDFTPFAGAGDFDAYLGATTLIDRRMTSPGRPWRDVARQNIAPAMQAWLRAVFRPGQRVACRDILALSARHGL